LHLHGVKCGIEVVEKYIIDSWVVVFITPFKCVYIVIKFIIGFVVCGVVFIVKRFCVSMFVCFIAAIYIACFYACSRSWFCVFDVKLARSFFIFSVSSSCFQRRLCLHSGEGGVSCSSCSAAGLAYCLSRVQLELSILLSANSSVVIMLPCSSSSDVCMNPSSLNVAFFDLFS
jgi:hypothetical protein